MNNKISFFLSLWNSIIIIDRQAFNYRFLAFFRAPSMPHSTWWENVSWTIWKNRFFSIGNRCPSIISPSNHETMNDVWAVFVITIKSRSIDRFASCPIKNFTSSMLLSICFFRRRFRGSSKTWKIVSCQVQHATEN